MTLYFESETQQKLMTHYSESEMQQKLMTQYYEIEIEQKLVTHYYEIMMQQTLMTHCDSLLSPVYFAIRGNLLSLFSGRCWLPLWSEMDMRLETNLLRCAAPTRGGGCRGRGRVPGFVASGVGPPSPPGTGVQCVWTVQCVLYSTVHYCGVCPIMGTTTATSVRAGPWKHSWHSPRHLSWHS